MPCILRIVEYNIFSEIIRDSGHCAADTRRFDRLKSDFSCVPFPAVFDTLRTINRALHSRHMGHEAGTHTKASTGREATRGLQDGEPTVNGFHLYSASGTRCGKRNSYDREEL